MILIDFCSKIRLPRFHEKKVQKKATFQKGNFLVFKMAVTTTSCVVLHGDSIG